MLDFIGQILDAKDDFSKFILFLLIYLALLWLMFSLWVFVDAQKRYRKPLIAILMFFMVLILNFPMLIFYLIIRPEKEDENVMYLQTGESEFSGVDVPVVNFTGENGVEMSLVIKFNKPNTVTNQDMKVNVDWVSSNPAFVRVEKKPEVKDDSSESTEETKQSRMQKIKSKFSGAGSAVKSKLSPVGAGMKKAWSILVPKRVDGVDDSDEVVEAPPLGAIKDKKLSRKQRRELARKEKEQTKVEA